MPWVGALIEALGTSWRTVAPPNSTGSPGALPAVLIIAAHLPNEAEIIEGTVEQVLRSVSYPGPWRLVLAYNTDRPLGVEQQLAEMAAEHSRLSLMRVPDSTTKAQNLNAALEATDESLVGILDADARPEPDVLRLAAEWIEGGWDFVQGANLVASPQTRLARGVAAEFAAKYLATYAGRFAGTSVAYFSGSNGYWDGDAIRSLRFDVSADVEDIDCSVRALLQGRKLAFDPRIRCWESAPATWRGLWRQRSRWAHGWVQLTGRYARSLARDRSLPRAHRVYWLYATVWRRALAPAAAIVVALIATYDALLGRLTPLLTVAAASILLAWLVGLVQGIVTARRPGAPDGLASPPAYAVSYVFAEAARLWASLLVLARRPPWTPTPRPETRPSR